MKGGGNANVLLCRIEETRRYWKLCDRFYCIITNFKIFEEKEKKLAQLNIFTIRGF